ncbi:hypothetical protein [Schaalia cardiffensis]|uniref:hypothetical protein n=1 Tax=Schaalia cardiffensis TaxID=181487 RepID=UPI0023F3A622|nr:hypothetical protein [Schaalia cardiffensis]
MSHSSVPVLAVLAFTVGALVGCSSASDSKVADSPSSSAMSSQSAAAETSAPSGSGANQQLVKELKEFGISPSSEQVATLLRADTELAQLENLGLDLQLLAKTFVDKISYEVSDAQVQGDTALVTIRVSIPDFNEEASRGLEEAFTQKVAESGIDPMAPDEATLIKLFSDTVNEYLASSSFPMKSDDFTVEYVRKNGTWEMKDPTDFDRALAEFMGSPQI